MASDGAPPPKLSADDTALAPKPGADDAAPPPKTGADDGAPPPKNAGVEDAALPAAKRNEPAPPRRWKDLPSEGACMPVLGVAELWPELGSAAASAKGKGKAPAASSTAPVDAPKITTAALPEQIPYQQGATSNKHNPGGASTSRYGNRAGSSSATQPSPMNMMMQNSNRERRDAAPMHAPSHRSNNNFAGARGHHQNGRFVPRPHGQGGSDGGEGYNRGGGGRRPVGGGANGRGDANGNAYRNRGGGGGWQGHEHRGGFNGQPRGRGHHGPEHRPLGPPMGHVEAPHHMHQPPLPQQQQFMGNGMAPPPMPYSYYYGLPYGYQEFFPGYFAPPLQEDPPHFMPEAPQPFVQVQYAWPPMHMMYANFEQQQQYAPQPQAQWQGAPPNQEQQLTPEEMQQQIRRQIEYYFSATNLETDTFLRGNMDEQGWVPLTVVASFTKILNRTRDIEFILNSVLPSTELEVQDGKIRKRAGWEEYLPLPPKQLK